MAVRAHNMLANGMGGIDWAGLPIVVAFLGVQDVERFVAALETVIAHRPARTDSDE